MVGKTNTQIVLTLEGYCGTNPGVTVSALLHNVTFAGSGSSIALTTGSQIAAGPTFTFTAQGQSFGSDGVVAAFPALNTYVPLISLSGTTAVNSAIWVTYKLYALNS